MKHLTMFLAFTFLLAIVSCKGNNRNQETVNAFVKDLADATISYETLMKNHLCAGQTADNSKIKEMKTNLLIPQLKGLRETLINASWNIKKYQDLPTEEQNIQINEKEKQNIYVVESNGKIICFVWAKDRKIASFSTLDKGGKRFFMKICND